MDSTCVYLTASTRKIFSDTAEFEQVHDTSLELAWYRLDGSRLCDAQVKSACDASFAVDSASYKHFCRVNRIFRNDAVICYDFSRLWKDRTEEDEESESAHAPEPSEDVDLIDPDGIDQHEADWDEDFGDAD